jgi:protein Mpv17
VLASVFAWNLALTGHPRAIPGKIRRDLPPTIVNGWKFWVPASVINFRVVPLEYQVRKLFAFPVDMAYCRFTGSIQAVVCGHMKSEP